MVGINVVEFPRRTARERLFALQGEQFTREVRREAEACLKELTDDHSPEVEAMRAIIVEAAEPPRGIWSEEEIKQANESSVMSALRYRSVCRACGR